MAGNRDQWRATKIAHCRASGYLPEHTLMAHAMAIELADVKTRR